MKPLKTASGAEKPSHWIEREVDGGMELVCSPGWGTRAIAVVSLLGVAGMLYVYVGNVVAGETGFLFCVVPLVLVALILIIGMVNGAVLRATPTELTLRDAPLPVPWGRARFARNDVAEVYAEKRGSMLSSTFWLRVRLADGDDKRLISFGNTNEAAYARNFVARYCGVDENKQMVEMKSGSGIGKWP
jgi:hypothetical protein